MPNLLETFSVFNPFHVDFSGSLGVVTGEQGEGGTSINDNNKDSGIL